MADKQSKFSFLKAPIAAALRQRGVTDGPKSSVLRGAAKNASPKKKGQ
jgi:hypothetical protein